MQLMAQTIISTNGMESYMIFIYGDTCNVLANFVMTTPIEFEYGNVVLIDHLGIENHVHRIDESPKTSK